MRRIGLLSLVAAAVFPASAFAAGFGLKEHSADAMAAVYAGAAATGSDASYLAYNPALLASVKETDFSVSAVQILAGTSAEYSSALTATGTTTGGLAKPKNFIADAIVPAVGFRQRLFQNWAVGLSISAPWGLRSDYPSTWAGRYYAQRSSLFSINAAPVVAYQITPDLSIGVGAQIQFVRGTLTSAIDTGTLGALNLIPGSIPGAQDSFASLSGKNWSYGYTAGLVDHIGKVTLGIAYRSSLQHHLKGPLTFTLDSAGIGAAIRSQTGLFTDATQTTAVTTPDMVTSGARIELSDAWTGLVEVDWTHWSRFHELRIRALNPAQPDDVTTMRWKDTFFASLGAEYRASPIWSFKAGAGYDQSPTIDAYREPRIPDADRVWLSAGVRYRMTENVDLSLTASRLFFLPSNIDLKATAPGAALRGTLAGTTNAYVDCVGFQVSYNAD